MWCIILCMWWSLFIWILTSLWLGSPLYTGTVKRRSDFTSVDLCGVHDNIITLTLSIVPESCKHQWSNLFAVVLAEWVCWMPNIIGGGGGGGGGGCKWVDGLQTFILEIFVDRGGYCCYSYQCKQIVRSLSLLTPVVATKSNETYYM